MHITDMLHCSYSSEEARNDVSLVKELVGSTVATSSLRFVGP